ncbi:MAG TPA: formylmethanofuran dehydrogenase, partial [Candidatus Acetothermia bacterium]|nr:formylmethanofuran dehydrogenase [Candidatus Acetothermia bacterium]
ADLDEMIERGVHLHGHLGPFLVAGIRMGRLALDLLNSPGYFGIHAVSETGDETPLSCLTDGVQIGSGCSIGKGNLRVTDAKRPRVHFETDDGNRVTITIRPEALEDFRRGEIIQESNRTAVRPLEELFAWGMES